MAQTSSASFAIDVSTRTWARETHSLFDFEAKASTLTSQNFTIKDSVTCVRTENDVDVVSFAAAQVPAKGESEKLIQVEWRHGKCYLNRPRWGTADDRRVQRCWHLIRDVHEGTTTGHRLAEHDVIKFGRSQFKVRQLSANAEAVALGDGLSSICKVDPAKFDELAETQCRICLNEGSCMEDPLLAPCQCRGSIRHVHFGCLKHWVRDRLGLSDGDTAFVVGGDPNRMACELCKSAYQTAIQIGDKLLPVVEIVSPFIVLESCSDHRLHVLPIVNGQPLKVGRGHECAMNIHDTSISRVQASIELVDGCFVLKDNGSRFGTYIKITKPLLLEVGQQSSVQVGRTLLQLSMKKPSSPACDSKFSSDEAPDTDIPQSPRGCDRCADSVPEEVPSSEGA